MGSANIHLEKEDKMSFEGEDKPLSKAQRALLCSVKFRRRKEEFSFWRRPWI
jgi:hypothetical protein